MLQVAFLLFTIKSLLPEYVILQCSITEQFWAEGVSVYRKKVVKSQV